MKLAQTLSNKYTQIGILLIIFLTLGWWKPHVLIEGIQRSSLYASVALPMALVLGIMGIINLAHGDFMMLGAYMAYFLSIYSGMDPFFALIPAILVFFVMGAIAFRSTIKYILKDAELNQLLLTFGISMVLVQTVNLIWTSAPVKASLDYISSSMTIGSISFGTFEFIYVICAVIILGGLLSFLKYTRTGQAALAVGQNPRGARLVGINIDWIYLMIFSLSIAIVGAMGVVFMARNSVFPGVGGGFTFRSFCLIAMAGFGNLTGIVWCSLILGLSENLILSFNDYAGWSDIVSFAIMVAVIMINSYRRQVK